MHEHEYLHKYLENIKKLEKNFPYVTSGPWATRGPPRPGGTGGSSSGSEKMHGVGYKYWRYWGSCGYGDSVGIFCRYGDDIWVWMGIEIQSPRQPWFLDTFLSVQFSLLPSAGREMSSSLRAMWWMLTVADWVCPAARTQTFTFTFTFTSNRNEIGQNRIPAGWSITNVAGLTDGADASSRTEGEPSPDCSDVTALLVICTARR